MASQLFGSTLQVCQSQTELPSPYMPIRSPVSVPSLYLHLACMVTSMLSWVSTYHSKFTRRLRCYISFATSVLWIRYLSALWHFYREIRIFPPISSLSSCFSVTSTYSASCRNLLCFNSLRIIRPSTHMLSKGLIGNDCDSRVTSLYVHEHLCLPFSRNNAS